MCSGNVLQPAGIKSTPGRIPLIIGLLAAFLAGLAEYNTVMNDLYQTGSVLFDVTMFATVLWRSGWALDLAPVFGGGSFFYTHVSPIFYIPDLLSYFYPGDRITFFALFYSLVYAGTVFVVYRLIVPLMPLKVAPLVAAVCAVLFFCSQPVFGAAFEPHMEVISPVFGMLMFSAWQRRWYGYAVLWLLVNASIREDIGVVFGLAVMGFATAQYLELRKSDQPQASERLRWGMLLFALGSLCTVNGFALQAFIAKPFQLMHDLYFPASHPFAHLTRQLLMNRATDIFHNHQGLWMPFVALLIASVVLSDAMIFMGSICFLPYFLVNFVSLSDNSATMTAYKPFPFVVMLLMPALVAIMRPDAVKWRYALLQCVVLTCSVVTYMPGVTWMVPRWFVHSLTYHPEGYRAFGEQQLPELLAGKEVYADAAVEALYPYQVGYWGVMDVDMIKHPEKVQTLIWFRNDDYNVGVKKILAQYAFTVSDVPGTHLRVGHRVP